MKGYGKNEIGIVIGRLAVLGLTGLVAGVLFGNLTFPYRNQESELVGLYLAEKLKESRIDDGAFFSYLLWHRLQGYILFVLAGFTGAARPMAAAGMMGMGFLAGAAGTMAVLQYGIRGMVLFGAAGMPQMLLYLPCLIVLFVHIWIYNGRVAGRYGEYLAVCFFCLIGRLLGILLEIYGNPPFFSWICEKI